MYILDNIKKGCRLMSTIHLPAHYKDFGVDQNMPPPQRRFPSKQIPQAKKRPLEPSPQTTVRVATVRPFKPRGTRQTDPWERQEFLRAAGPRFTGKLADGTATNAYRMWLARIAFYVPVGMKLLSDTVISQLFRYLNLPSVRLKEDSPVKQLTKFAEFSNAQRFDVPTELVNVCYINVPSEDLAPTLRHQIVSFKADHEDTSGKLFEDAARFIFVSQIRIDKVKEFIFLGFGRKDWAKDVTENWEETELVEPQEKAPVVGPTPSALAPVSAREPAARIPPLSLNTGQFIMVDKDGNVIPNPPATKVSTPGSGSPSGSQAGRSNAGSPPTLPANLNPPPLALPSIIPDNPGVLNPPGSIYNRAELGGDDDEADDPLMRIVTDVDDRRQTLDPMIHQPNQATPLNPNTNEAVNQLEQITSLLSSRNTQELLDRAGVHTSPAKDSYLTQQEARFGVNNNDSVGESPVRNPNFTSPTPRQTPRAPRSSPSTVTEVRSSLPNIASTLSSTRVPTAAGGLASYILPLETAVKNLKPTSRDLQLKKERYLLDADVARDVLGNIYTAYTNRSAKMSENDKLLWDTASDKLNAIQAKLTQIGGKGFHLKGGSLKDAEDEFGVFSTSLLFTDPATGQFVYEVSFSL